jgi:hypothetical protein
MVFHRRRLLGAISLARNVVGGGGGGGGGPTWDPANTHADISLDGTKLIATQTGTDVFRNARATSSFTGTKKFFTIIITNDASDNSTVVVGFGNASQSLAAYLGNSNAGWGYSDGGAITLNGANPSLSMDHFDTSNTIYICIDDVNKLFWAKVNTGFWNTDGAGDPTNTSTGAGISYSTMAAGPYFPMIGLWKNGDIVTANFASTTNMPSGYSLIT